MELFTLGISSGVFPDAGVDFFCPPVETLYVINLTHDITPQPGTPGINFVKRRANGANGGSAPVAGGDGDNGGTGGWSASWADPVS